MSLLVRPVNEVLQGKLNRLCPWQVPDGEGGLVFTRWEALLPTLSGALLWLSTWLLKGISAHQKEERNPSPLSPMSSI